VLKLKAEEEGQDNNKPVNPEISKKMAEDQQMMTSANNEEGEGGEEAKKEEEIFIPQAEYTAVCNCDMAPLICNEFVTEFLDREHGACKLDRGDAIDLTRNFCHFLKSSGLSCAKIHLLSSY
jgi:hypothetical protein